MVDDFLISSMEGVELKLHKPEARDVAITCDAPWEGNTSAYFTLFKDEGQTPSLPDARPRSDRFRCGGRESNFLAAIFEEASA